MDPTAALVDLLDALRRHDREVAYDRLEALLDWLSRGIPRRPGTRRRRRTGKERVTRPDPTRAMWHWSL